MSKQYLVLGSYIGNKTNVPRVPKDNLAEAINHAKGLILRQAEGTRLLIVEVVGIVEREAPPITFRTLKDDETLEGLLP